VKTQKLTLTLPGKKVEYFLGENLLPVLPKFFKKTNTPAKILIIADSFVHKLYGKQIEKIFKSSGHHPEFVLISPGESSKNLNQIKNLYEKFCQLKISRNTSVAALGGGVMTDLVSFAASTFMRGLPLILIPTTLLAQADAAVGGKTGINLKQGKNLVGSFYHPELVLLDIQFLRTLSQKEIRNGMAEIIKMSLLEGEKGFQALEKASEEIQTCGRKASEEWSKKIRPYLYAAVRKKISIVEKDPYEKNERMILNLGHTFAHGIEAAGEYKTYSHGEAVAIGLVGACLLGEKIEKFPPEQTRRVEKLLSKIHLPIRYKKLNPIQVFDQMALDKKKTETIRFILPKTIGKVVICDKIAAAQVLDTLQMLKED
jgi:3-dehydroquinate synthase